MNKKKIKIITDSTWDLSNYYKRKFNIDVVPLYVKIGEKIYKDLIDIDKERFYLIMKDKKTPFQTYQPTPNDFIQIYNKYIKDFDNILSIHISSKLSGVVNSCNIAKNEIDKDKKIIIYDSGFVSGALGLMVTEASILANSGKEIYEIISYLNFLKKKIKSIFILENLEILYRSGRLDKTKFLIGSMFGFMPFLTIQDGIIVPYKSGKIRGKKNIITSILSYFKNNYNGGRLKGGIAHNFLEDSLPKILKKEIIKIANIDSFVIQKLGIITTAQIGINSIGLSFFEY